MDRFNDDQLNELRFGREHGLDVSRYTDPEYSAERMEILNSCLMDGYGEEMLELMLDKTISDATAWNMLICLLEGKTLEEMLMGEDEKEF